MNPNTPFRLIDLLRPKDNLEMEVNDLQDALRNLDEASTFSKRYLTRILEEKKLALKELESKRYFEAPEPWLGVVCCSQKVWMALWQVYQVVGMQKDYGRGVDTELSSAMVTLARAMDETNTPMPCIAPAPGWTAHQQNAEGTAS